MSKYCLDNLDKLEILAVSNTIVVKDVLRDADEDFCTALRELIDNTLNGPVQLSGEEKAKLIPYRKKLYDIIRGDTNLLRRRGHKFLPVLLPSALDALKRWLRDTR